jgi:hypothetical protein
MYEVALYRFLDCPAVSTPSLSDPIVPVAYYSSGFGILLVPGYAVYDPYCIYLSAPNIALTFPSDGLGINY